MQTPSMHLQNQCAWHQRTAQTQKENAVWRDEHMRGRRIIVCGPILIVAGSMARSQSLPHAKWRKKLQKRNYYHLQTWHHYNQNDSSNSKVWNSSKSLGFQMLSAAEEATQIGREKICQACSFTASPSLGIAYAWAKCRMRGSMGSPGLEFPQDVTNSHKWIV